MKFYKFNKIQKFGLIISIVLTGILLKRVIFPYNWDIEKINVIGKSTLAIIMIFKSLLYTSIWLIIWSGKITFTNIQKMWRKK